MSDKIGNKIDGVLKILEAAMSNESILSDFEKTFVPDFHSKAEKYGAEAYMSSKQEQCIRKLETKLREKNLL